VKPDAIATLLRSAHAGFVKRKRGGSGAALADRLILLGWLAPAPGMPGMLGITLHGEIELRHRL
jgi:hypothetical protein